MNIAVDSVSPIQRKIRVEVPADAVDQEFLRVYENLGRRARVRGFRPGKVPRSVLQGLYADEVKGEVLSRLVERSVGAAVKEHALQIVSRPEIEANDLREGEAFAFSALVEVKPEVMIKNYTGLEVEKVKLSVDQTQVEAALSHLQGEHAQLQPVEERDVVEAGDYVILDFSGSVDGKPFPGSSREGHALELGSGKALPQFEESIIGLKRGHEHNISVPYPEDYFNRELAGKTASFLVTVQSIKKKVLPALDDEFAKDHGEAASIGELKAKLRERLQNEIAALQTADLREKVLSRLIEENPFAIPPAMVDRQVHYMMERRQSRLAAQGASTSADALPLDQWRKDLEPQARRQVQATLLLEKIAGLEKIAVTDDELHQKIEEYARAAGDRAPTVREIYRQSDARNDLRSQMILDRAVEILLERAKVKEVAPPVDDQGKKR